VLLIGISCSWIVGIWLGTLFNFPATWMLSAVLPVPFIFIFKELRKPLLIIALSLLFFFAGSWLSTELNHQTNPVTTYSNQGRVSFEGFVSDPPEKRDNRSQIVFTIRKIDGQVANGKVLYNTYSTPNIQYGDIIQGDASFQSPPIFEDFDYKAYLAGQGIYAIVQEMNYRITERGAGSGATAWIFALRQRLADSMAAALPEPQASLCQGIVLGVRANISQDLKTDLSKTGTTHLLAISGLNLTIIAGLLLSLGLLFFGRRHFIYVWLTLIIIWFYSFLTGLQAPIIRSAIMASIFLLAELLGRQRNAFPALVFSAAIMVAFSPPVLRNLSFQLSFLAMSGLIFITPVLTGWGRNIIYAVLGEEGFWPKILTTVTDSFSVSLGAVIAVWPVSAYTFGIISLVGPLTTFAMAPALTPIIVFGSLTAFVGLFSPPIAQVTGWIAWLFLSYMVVIAGAFAVVPGAYVINRHISAIFIWLYYALFLVLMNLKSALRDRPAGWFKSVLSDLFDWSSSAGSLIGKRAKFIMPPLLIIAILVSLAAVTMPGRNLKVSFLDVGEGESILIQTEGQSILIDGGPSGQKVCQELGNKLPFWDRKIDMLVLTHPHLDHLTGLLEILKRYRVKKVLASPVISNLPAYNEWLQITQYKKIEYLIAQAGQRIVLSSGAKLEVLNPAVNIGTDSKTDPDENAVVASLSYGPHSFLFTSDIGYETELRLQRERLVNNTEILKIAHHGSEQSSSATFLRAVNPSIAVISVGAQNQFGHPARGTLERISESGIKTLYRTDLDGTVTFELGISSSEIHITKGH
jgi:competence protein ComEC